MLKIVKQVFRKLGYAVVPIAKPQKKGSYTYQEPKVYASYAPWLEDQAFQQVHQLVKANTLVDPLRAYELFHLAAQAVSLNPEAAMIEVGVWRGGTAGVLARKISLFKSKAHLYLADTFEGVVKTSEHDTVYVGGEHKDTSSETVTHLLSKQLGFNNYTLLKGIFPEQTSHLIPPGTRFSLCHIDVDVYLSAKDILDWVFPKLILGGIVVFDDYGFETCSGVTKLVNEYFHRDDRVVIHNINGHAIMIKTKL